LPVAPNDSKNIGSIGIIISLLRSFRKLTTLRIMTLRKPPFLPACGELACPELVEGVEPVFSISYWPRT
jgi:hypothetical protein